MKYLLESTGNLYYGVLECTGIWLKCCTGKLKNVLECVLECTGISPKF